MADEHLRLVRTAAVARLVWGALLIAAPRWLLRPFGSVTPVAVVTLRALGIRHLAQGGLLLWHPTPVVLTLSTVADRAHGATALALAAVDRRQRYAALADAGIAAAWSATGRPAASRREKDRES
ncbi:hypothetical protein ACL02O_29780 [Micromonospora sp. MS34]|uniref:hypothetical protein n=1 Tax=Micromonospora sp. MS34 TaxID=3385971 RepID=UPI00399F8F7F